MRTAGSPRVRAAVQTLNPGYFALVMATGIISIAMRTHHAIAVSVLLLWLTVVEYVTLVLLTLWRAVAFRVTLATDLANPRRAFGVFTFVAGTDVLGARLTIEMADAPMVTATHGLVAGTSVVFWAFGSWLVPALIAASIWRHLARHVPLRYEAALWSVIFPLGMYGVASHYLGQTDHLPFVRAIGADESWVALAAWAIAFAAMLGHLARSIAPHQSS